MRRSYRIAECYSPQSSLDVGDRGCARMNQSADDFDYAFTITEGFFVCDRRSHELVRELSPRFVEDVRTHLATGTAVAIRKACVDVTSHSFLLAPESGMDMPLLRDSLAGIAQSHGLSLIAAGTHPLGTSHELQDRLPSSKANTNFRIVEPAQQTCGLRVQVTVPPGIDRAALMNRSIPWLPLFLALSTSSPFWNGSVSGLLSCRQARLDLRPCGATSDFSARSAAAVELNIADACIRVEDSVAIANLFRCYVAALIRGPQAGDDRTPHLRRIAEENLARASRNGMGAEFVGDQTSSTVSVRRLLAAFLGSLESQIARFGCGPLLTALVDIANGGTSAHQQLRIYEEARSNGSSHRAALAGVLEWLTVKAADPRRRWLTNTPRQPIASSTRVPGSGTSCLLANDVSS